MVLRGVPCSLRRWCEPINDDGLAFLGACVTWCVEVLQEPRLPNENAGSAHISLRVPNDLIQAFDKLAAMLERPRSWVMLRALRQYLEDEGAELAEDAESLAELDRGESVSAEDVRRQVKRIIARTEKARARHK
jgi:predicted transcriptional regulator